MVQHFESGACVSNMDRNTINRPVDTYDAVGPSTIEASPPQSPNLLPNIHPLPDHLHFHSSPSTTSSSVEQDDDIDSDEGSVGDWAAHVHDLSRPLSAGGEGDVGAGYQSSGGESGEVGSLGIKLLV